MAKYIIKEGITEKFIRFVFSSVAKGKKTALEKAIANDPKMKTYIAQLDRLRASIDAHLQTHSDTVVNNPEWQELVKSLENPK